MKQAIVGGFLKDAGADSPNQAVCPVCWSTVFLRTRTNADESLTYFWRHPKNAPSDCSQRKKTRNRGETMQGRYPGEQADEL